MKQQIIAIVGPDMCGKTEIASALCEELDLPYFKASSEHETYLRHPDRFIQQLRFADTRMLDFLKQTGYSVVFDRAWPCEFAYSSVFKRPTDMNVLTRVDEGMAALGAKIIITHRSSYKGIVDDIDPTTREDRLDELDAAYRRFMLQTKCGTLLLNVDDECLEREIRHIKQFLALGE